MPRSARTSPSSPTTSSPTGTRPPAILVYVDCWTSLGGSQFLDSPGTGRYHTYLCDEVVPWVDERYRTLAGRPSTAGIAGKSSGGYGAMVTPMLRPDLFGGLATHAGDALFEACYLPEFRRRRERSATSTTAPTSASGRTSARGRPSRRTPTTCSSNQWCMAACYSTDEDGTVRLPFDPATGELDPRGLGALAGLGSGADGRRSTPTRSDRCKAIYIDAGKQDEWFLDLGAEAFRRALEEIGVTDVYFELFDATHMAIEYRYPLGIRYLAERLSP